MMNIALYGESPNDTLSIISILEKKYSEHNFYSILNNIKGDEIDNQKNRRLFRIEYESSKPNLVIVIRDLDELKNRKKVLARKTDFNELNSRINGNGIFLLCIYEIEALILADIEVFNKEYNTNVQIEKNPTHYIEPKEFLKIATIKSIRKFNESHCPEILSKCDFDKLLVCDFFQEFIKELESRLKN